METEQIFCGNAKEAMLNSFSAESVDLIYIDPPFFSNRNYEIVWGNGFELKAYEDRWQGGIENYIAWMEPVIMQCHRVLKPTGSMYIHCDTHANAHLRILMDRIFGANRFLNEVIWHYRTGGVSKRWWAQKNDTIMFYSKGPKWTFNPLQIKEYYSEIYGRDFKPGLVDRNGGHDEGGFFHMVYADNVWNIPGVFNMSKEYLGYPTQKPLALLERIIVASSNEGDLVLDPMCGGGTTLAAAQKLHRKWVGIDVSPLACKKTETRLRLLGASPKLIGMPMSIKALRTLQPFMFQQWVIEKLYAHPSQRKVGDMGVDGALFDGTPLQVKQSEGIGRNVVDNFETAIRRLKKTSGIIVAFSFGKGAYEEVARVKNADGINITLKTVDEILESMGAHEAELEALDWAAKEEKCPE